MEVPSIDLCKELKDIWYNQEKYTYLYDDKWQLRHSSELIWFWPPENHIVAPTVIELIDKIPLDIIWSVEGYKLTISKAKNKYIVRYHWLDIDFTTNSTYLCDWLTKILTQLHSRWLYKL